MSAGTDVAPIESLPAGAPHAARPPCGRIAISWCLVAAALVWGAPGCRSVPIEPAPSAPRDASSGFVCGHGDDFGAFENLRALRTLNELTPRKNPTPEQRKVLSPGDPFWQFKATPDRRCSEEGYLQLRYVVAGSQDFSSSRDRVTVTIAPGGRLLDQLAYDRMASLANALDEALTLLRAKTCSESGAPCDLKRNPDPLRFPDSQVQYSVTNEFKKIGSRGWTWNFTRGAYRVVRTVFSTSDGRFDVEVLIETMDNPHDGTSALHLLSERISDDYNRETPARSDQGGRGG